METFLKIAKAGAVMFVVGVLLATIAQPLADIIGPKLLGDVGVAAASNTARSVLWTGAFFGTFGALHSGITTIIDKMDGTSRKVEIAQARVDAHVRETMKGACCEPDLGPEQEVISNYHQQLQDARRAAPAGVAPTHAL